MIAKLLKNKSEHEFVLSFTSEEKTYLNSIGDSVNETIERVVYNFLYYFIHNPNERAFEVHGENDIDHVHIKLNNEKGVCPITEEFILNASERATIWLKHEILFHNQMTVRDEFMHECINAYCRVNNSVGNKEIECAMTFAYMNAWDRGVDYKA